jgi:hypothetical protein
LREEDFSSPGGASQLMLAAAVFGSLGLDRSIGKGAGICADPENIGSFAASGSGCPSLASSARRSAKRVCISSEICTEVATIRLVTRYSSSAIWNCRASG